MELIIQILMVFVLMTTALKLSLTSHYWQIAYALLCASFLVYIYPYCMEQTKPSIEAYIAIRSLREHTALFISLEVLMWLVYCFSGHSYSEETQILTRDTYLAQGISLLLKYYPGFLLFPILFYLQTQLFFGLAGASFEFISYSLAIATALLIPLLCYGISYLLPERELRRELLFLSALIVFALGLVMTVDEEIQHHPSPSHYSTADIMLALAVFALCFVIGKYGYLLRMLLQRLSSSLIKSNKH